MRTCIAVRSGVVTALIVVLAACGQTSTSPAASGGGNVPTASPDGATTEPTAAPATTAPGPTGSFSVAVGEPDNLTPGRQTVAYDQVPALFASLTLVDESGVLQYLQAESVTSPDATVWTIKLRPGWTFHNGEPVTAQNFADAWNATALGTNAWGNNGQFAKVVGYDALNPSSGSPTATTLSGVKVIDALTLEVTLKGADSQFPLQLSKGQTGWYPMPKAAFDDLEAYNKKPIGNGPFMMADAWQANQPIRMVAYDGYAGTKPLAKEITFKSYSDQNTGYTDVLAGNTDMQFVPFSKYTQVKSDFGDRLYVFDAVSIDFLGFPLYDKRFQDPRIRKAISMAIDRDAVNQAIFGGFYVPSTALTPAAATGSPTGICDACKFDPAAAKALLAEAGGWSGPMTLWYPGGIGQDELWTAIANQIRQNLGIADVTPKATADWSAYWTSLTEKEVDGPHFGHWGSLYPSMQDTLRNVYTKAGGCYPCSTYSNPEVDALLAQADAATSLDEGTRLYVEAQERILQDFPLVPLLDSKWLYATSERISNVVGSAGAPMYDKVSVKQ